MGYRLVTQECQTGIVVLPGRVIFVELKDEGGTLKPIQRLQLQHLDALGQECYVVCGMAGVKLFAEIIGADCNIYTDNEKRSKALERMKEYRHGV